MEAKEEQIENSKEACRHPRLLQGKCINCDKFIDLWYGVAFDFLQEGLNLSHEEITRLKDTNSKKLFAEKKLQLVLDLDNTLLHSKLVEKLTPEDKYLENQADFFQDISKGSLFKLKKPERLVKLRPFVRNFLKEASTMFEMYVFTMGSKLYAKRMVELLDPEGKYFENNRVISRDDLVEHGKKSLDLVLGRESGIIIIDDDASVWPDHNKNLIPIISYSYFSENWNYINKSCSEITIKEDESENYGALAYIITVLRAIHGMFFSENISSLPCRDVRMLMEILRSKVLKGCVIFFSGVNQSYYSNFIVKAKKLGAECINILDSRVTHVVSATNKARMVTEDFDWAEKEKKYLVNPRWIHCSYLLWHRQQEDRFPVSK